MWRRRSCRTTKSLVPHSRRPSANPRQGDGLGGGKEASIQSSTVNIGTDGTNSFIDQVFGGGDRADLSGNAVVSMTAGKVLTAVYGGCNEQGTLTGNTSVTLTGGTIGTDQANANVHGGGFGPATYVKGNVAVQVGTIDQDPATTVTIWGDVYGGSAQGHVNAYPVDADADEDNRKYSTDKTTKVSLIRCKQPVWITQGRCYG